MARASTQDADLERVATEIGRLDPSGARVAQVLRDTLDQLYDGQRTGRYRWDQLHKTEKTHCGTLVEINLHREFNFGDGIVLDYQIGGIDVDCKYSQSLYNWMIPPEACNHVCLLVWADDAKSQWSMGVTRITEERINTRGNRDRKATLNVVGRATIFWLYDNAELPPNALLHLPRPTVDRILGLRHGTQRVNELFRSALHMRIGRGVVATVAQQEDYMKRIRANGGARTALKAEGIIILGQYKSHAAIAAALGVPQPGRGESVSVRVAPATKGEPHAAEVDGRLWKAASEDDPAVEAPDLPGIAE